MKWLINFISLKKLLYIALQLCIFKLLIHNVFAYNNKASSPPIIRHPGTCTFQQSQAACTFSLLCYLAGGIPIEGCGTDTSTTCCVLQHSPSVQQMLDYSKFKTGTNENDQSDKSNLLTDLVQPPTNLPPSSTTYADQPQPSIPTSNLDSLSVSKNPSDRESSSTESSLISNNNLQDSNKYSNEDSSLHSSSSSLSASTNLYKSYDGYQTHHHNIHTPRSLYPSINPSLQYHHRLQHHTYPSISNPHLNHQKQHQHNLFLHQQHLASHPSLSSHSLYQSAAYQHPHHYSSLPYHHTQPSSNARSFQLSRYSNPLLPQYQSNYLLNDNLNYYTNGESPTYGSSTVEQSPPSSYPTDHLNSFNDQTNPYPSSLSDMSIPSIVPSSQPNSASYEPDSLQQPPLAQPYLNDYSNPSPTSVPSSSSSLLTSFSPTQTIDYKTYQKHSLNPNPYLNSESPSIPPIYSTSSTSSYESTTNHTSNHHLLNSNKMYYPTAAEPPASIKYYNTNPPKTAVDYETNTNYNSNTQVDDSPVNSINSDEETSSLIHDHYPHNNIRLPNEDEYNSNAIRRSRLASSPLNSIAIDGQTHSRNFIGEDVCGKPISKPTKRIIGGQDAYYAEFPWMVHIKVGKHQCGGTLISRDFVITAAHCVYQAPLDQLTIIIGAHDIESKNSKFYDEIPQHHVVESVILHPNFRFSAAHPDRFDVALLKLKRKAMYTNTVRPICLPPKQLKLEGWRGTVTGWGKTESSLANRYGTRLLQKVDVPIIKNFECEKWHQTRGIDLKIFSEMMCAGYEEGQKDACVGDSGGPLIIFLSGRWVLAGITSAGFGCAQAQQPGIYHRVSFTVDWIQSILNQYK